MGVDQLFIERVEEVLPKLEHFIAEITRTRSIGEHLDEALYHDIHKLAGTSAVFGFPELGFKAEEVEMILDSFKENEFKDVQHLDALLESLQALRNALCQVKS